MTEFITQYRGDARELIREVRGPIDLVFLNHGFPIYYPCFMEISVYRASAWTNSARAD